MAVFNFRPSRGPRLLRKPRVLSAGFGDGYEQRTADGINNNLQSWELSFKSVTDARADAIEAFLDARAGHESFDWTPPRKAQAKFVCREWTRDHADVDNNTLAMRFEQVPG